MAAAAERLLSGSAARIQAAWRGWSYRERTERYKVMLDLERQLSLRAAEREADDRRREGEPQTINHNPRLFGPLCCRIVHFSAWTMTTCRHGPPSNRARRLLPPVI